MNNSPKMQANIEEFRQFLIQEEDNQINDVHPNEVSTNIDAIEEILKYVIVDDISQKKVLKISQPNVISEFNEMKPEHKSEDIESCKLNSKYDVVICVNILQKIKNPVDVLYKLANATREQLVLVMDSVHKSNYNRTQGLRWYEKYILNKLPVIFVDKGVPLARDKTGVKKFYFSPRAIRNILANHMKIFSRVDIVTSQSKERIFVIAKRKKIENLLIVSGPTASGKSTFLQYLKDKKLPHDIIKLIGRESQEWPQTSGKRMVRENITTVCGKKLRIDEIEGLVVHYDILRPISTHAHDYSRDQTLDILKNAENIDVIILKNEKSILLDQFISSELGGNSEYNNYELNNVQKILRIILRVIPRTIEKYLKRLPVIGKTYKNSRNDIIRKDKIYYKRLLNKYNKSDWLDSWYERWTKYLLTNYNNISVHIIEWPPKSKIYNALFPYAICNNMLGYLGL